MRRSAGPGTRAQEALAVRDYSASVAETCIFCGGTPMSREHLWPNWLRQEAAIAELFDHRLEQEVDGVETRDINFSTPPFNQVVRAVCAACNGGWMSTIEANVKPIMQDLIYGRGRTLDRDDKRKIATWAFLKACVFDELHPREQVVPREHCARLFTYKKPPPTGVAIWLGTYEAQEVGHYAYQGLLVARTGLPDPERPTVYIATITVGTLIIQVAGSVVDGLGFDDLDLADLAPELHVVRVWPQSDDVVVFAQDHVMDHETLLGFTRFLYNAIGHLTAGAPPAR
jgi:hypothetical protein